MPTPIRIASWGLTLALVCSTGCALAQRTPSPDDPRSVIAETQQNAKKQGMVRVGGVTWKCSSRLCIATTRNAPAGVNACQALAEQVGSLSRFGRVSKPIPSYDLALCNVRAQIKLAKIEQQRADAEAARERRQSPRGAAKPAPTAPPVVAAPRSLPVAPADPVARRDASPTTRRDAPPVVEASPIAPSYRPPVYAIRVMQLAVVGRGALGAESAPPPAQESLEPAPQDAPARAPQQARAIAPQETAPHAGPARQSFDVPSLALVGHGRLQEVPQGTHLTVTVDKLELVGKTGSEQ